MTRCLARCVSATLLLTVVASGQSILLPYRGREIVNSGDEPNLRPAVSGAPSFGRGPVQHAQTSVCLSTGATIRVPLTGVLKQNEFSVCTWFKFTAKHPGSADKIWEIVGSTANVNSIFLRTASSAQDAVILSKLQLDIYGPGYQTFVSNQLNKNIANQWYHTCATYNLTLSPSLLTYRNGEVVISDAYNAWNLMTQATDSHALLLGNGIDACYADTRVYRHALSLAEVRALYEGLVLHYTFDDRNARDVAGDRDGDVVHTVTYEERSTAAGHALCLDGVRGHVVAPHIDNLNGVSICTWLKATAALSGWMKFVDWGADFLTLGGVSMAISPQLRVNFFDPSSTIQWNFQTGPTITLGVWTHYCVVWDVTGGSGIAAYVDGALVASSAYNTYNLGQMGYNGRTSMFLGRSKWLGDPQSMPVCIDDFRVYNYPLTAGQVSNIFVGDSAVDAKPYIHLRADVGVVVTAGAVTQWNDQSGNGLHFTPYGSAGDNPITLEGSDAALNGHPGVRFNAGFFLIRTGLVAPGPTHTVIAVMRKTDILASRCVSSHHPNWLFGMHANDIDVALDLGGGWFGAVDNFRSKRMFLPRIYTINSNAASGEFFANGRLRGRTLSTNLNSGPWGSMTVGGWLSTQKGNCVVGEVLYFTKSLSCAEQRRWEARLGAKYGIPVDGSCRNEVQECVAYKATRFNYTGSIVLVGQAAYCSVTASSAACRDACASTDGCRQVVWIVATGACCGMPAPAFVDQDGLPLGTNTGYFSYHCSPKATASLVGHWAFERGSTLDRTGNWPTPFTTKFFRGRYVETDTSNYAQITDYFGPVLPEFSICAKVEITNASVVGGSAASLLDPSENSFNAIVWSEQEKGRWFGGSNSFGQSVNFAEEPPSGIHTVCVVGTRANFVVGYVNGAYSDKRSSSTAVLNKWREVTSTTRFNIGRRHLTKGELAARVYDVRLYARTLAACNAAVHCNGHGTATFGAEPDCSCTCDAGYTGADCADPVPYQYLPLDIDTRDASANGRDATAESGAGIDWSTSVCGGGSLRLATAVINGPSAGPYLDLQLQDAHRTAPLHDYTISLWFRRPADAPADGAVLFALGELNQGHYHELRTAYGNGKMAWAGFRAHGMKLWLAGKDFYGTPRWTHYAVVVNPTDNVVRLYVDGTESQGVAWNNDPSGTPAELDEIGSHFDLAFRIGKARFTDGAEYLRGHVDEVRIFAAALPASRIQQLYNDPCQLKQPLAGPRLTGVNELNAIAPGGGSINGNQHSPAIAAKPNGDFVVSFASTPAQALQVTVLAGGLDAAAPNSRRVNPFVGDVTAGPTGRTFSHPVCFADGSYIVVYQADFSGAGGIPKHRAQKFSSSNTLVGPAVDLPLQAVGLSEAFPAVCLIKRGTRERLLIGRRSGTSLFGYFTDGSLLAFAPSPHFVLTDRINGNQGSLSLTVLNNNNILAVWETSSSGDYDIAAKIWDPIGRSITPEFVVNEKTTGNQKSLSTDDPNVAVAVAPDGSVVIVWTDDSADGSASAVVARRFAEDGTALSGDFLINDLFAGNQHNPDVAMVPGGSGDFVVVYVDESRGTSFKDVRYRQFSLDGVPLGASVLVPSVNAGNQERPRIAAQVGGPWLAVVYNSNMNEHTTDGGIGSTFVRAVASPPRHFPRPSPTFDAPQHLWNTENAGPQSPGAVVTTEAGDFVGLFLSGNHAGAVGTDVLYTVIGGRNDNVGVRRNQFPPVGILHNELGGEQTAPSATPLPSGGWLAAWQTTHTGTARVAIRRFSKYDVPLRAVQMLMPTTGGTQIAPALVTLANGSALVAWEDSAIDGNGAGIAGCFVDVTTEPPAVGPVFVMNTGVAGTQAKPAMVRLPDGHVVVAYETVGTSAVDVVARIIDASGNEVVPEFALATVTTHAETTPTLAVAADGTWVAAWVSSAIDGDGSGVVFRLFGPDGTPSMPSEIVANADAHEGNQFDPTVAFLADGSGDFVVAYTTDNGANGDGSGRAVLMRRFNDHGYARTPSFQVNSETAMNQERPKLAVSKPPRNGVAVMFMSGDDVALVTMTFESLALNSNTSVISTIPQTPPTAAEPWRYGGGTSGTHRQAWTTDGVELLPIPSSGAHSNINSYESKIKFISGADIDTTGQHWANGALFDGKELWCAMRDSNAMVRVDTSNALYATYSSAGSASWPGNQGFTTGTLNKLRAVVTDAANGDGWFVNAQVHNGVMALVKVHFATATFTAYTDFPTCLSVTEWSGGTVFDGARAWLVPSGASHTVAFDFAPNIAAYDFASIPDFRAASMPFLGGCFNGQDILLPPLHANMVVRHAPSGAVRGGFRGADWPTDLETIGFYEATMTPPSVRRFVGCLVDRNADAWLVPFAATKVVRMTRDGHMRDFDAFPSPLNHATRLRVGFFDGVKLWLLTEQDTGAVGFLRVDTRDGTMSYVDITYQTEGKVPIDSFVIHDGGDIWIGGRKSFLLAVATAPATTDFATGPFPRPTTDRGLAGNYGLVGDWYFKMKSAVDRTGNWGPPRFTGGVTFNEGASTVLAVTSYSVGMVVRLRNAAWSTYVTLGGPNLGAPATLTSSPGDSANFVIETVPGTNYVTLKCVFHNSKLRFWTGSPGSVDGQPGATGPWEKLTIEANTDGTVRFRTAHGTYMYAASSTNGLPLQSTATPSTNADWWVTDVNKISAKSVVYDDYRGPTFRDMTICARVRLYSAGSTTYNYGGFGLQHVPSAAYNALVIGRSGLSHTSVGTASDYVRRESGWSPESLELYRLYQICAVWRDTNGFSNQTVYVNGRKQAEALTQDLAPWFGRRGAAGALRFSIGPRYTFGDDGFHGAFDGEVHRVRLWGRALDEGELLRYVKDVYPVQNRKPPPPT